MIVLFGMITKTASLTKFSGGNGCSHRRVQVGQRWPVVTSWFVLSAVVVGYVPSLRDFLIYDREAILSGQLWRMFTGHFVHFSSSHLFYDATALGIASWIIESQDLRYGRLLLLLAPVVISIALIIFEPQMQFYGGLSGVATAAVVYLAVGGLRQKSPWRAICAGALVLIATKIVFESTTNGMLFVTAEEPAFISVTSHVAGVVVGTIYAIAELRGCVAFKHSN